MGIAKSLGVTPQFALHEISYANVIMYSHSIPVPGDSDEEAPIYDDTKDACTDIDLNDTDDEEIIKAR